MTRYEKAITPNTACRIPVSLLYWTNSVSDGWCYWPKPCRSASKLIDLLESRRYSHDDDITLTELRKALSPIKSMLTRARGAIGRLQREREAGLVRSHRST